MRRAVRMLTVLVAAVSVPATVAAAGLAPARAASSPHQTRRAAGLRWDNCPERSAQQQYRAQCTTLMVPEDWSAPAGPRIGIALMRIPATGRSSGPVLADSEEANGYGGSQIAFFLAHGSNYLDRLPDVHRTHDIIVSGHACTC